MYTIRWEDVRDDFGFDGSWRDIYVRDTDATDWQFVLDGIRSSEYSVSYMRYGESPSPPWPVAVDLFSAPDSGESLLVIDVGGVEINCHFFFAGEIEFDLDPRQVTGQAHLDRVLGFMKLVANSSGKPVVLTPENQSSDAILEVAPRTGQIVYTPGLTYVEAPRMAYEEGIVDRCMRAITRLCKRLRRKGKL